MAHIVAGHAEKRRFTASCNQIGSEVYKSLGMPDVEERRVYNAAHDLCASRILIAEKNAAINRDD
jgi:hypothetical protein